VYFDPERPAEQQERFEGRERAAVIFVVWFMRLCLPKVLLASGVYVCVSVLKDVIKIVFVPATS
jgi:hypothetical protein